MAVGGLDFQPLTHSLGTWAELVYLIKEIIQVTLYISIQ